MATESKYFCYLSGLTVKELRYIARESGLYEYTALRKANLIRFLDRRSRVIKKCVEKRMFPDAMKAWVELFAPNEFAAEHYTQMIMNTLSDMSYFGKKKSVVSRKTRPGRRRQNEVIEDRLDAESSSDEDIGDSDSVDVSWCDCKSANNSDEINDNDIKICKEVMEFSDFKKNKYF